MTERSPSLDLSLAGNRLSNTAMKTVSEWTRKSESLQIMQPVENAEGSEDTSAKMLSGIELLQKEASSLRSQCSEAQEKIFDQQRQLDVAAIKIVELELELERRNFKLSTTVETLRAAELRASAIADDQNRLLQSWHSERSSLTDEVNRLTHQKESLERAHAVECEGLKAVVARHEVRMRMCCACA